MPLYRLEKFNICEGVCLNKHRLFIMVLSSILLIILIQSSRGENVNMIDIYSDINSADVTLRSYKYYTGITINADLLLDGKVLASRHIVVEEIFPDILTTKIISWNITDPPNGIYQTRFTLFMNSTALDTKQYTFSQGWGWKASPGLYIKDILPDSNGISVILAPFIPQTGSDQKLVLTDVEYMLVDGDTVIYRTTDRRVSVEQATTISRKWNVRLINNHPYSGRVKVRFSAQEDNIIAESREFVAVEDVRITELYRDETGASITILGSSQVPFAGYIEFVVSKNNTVIENIRKPSPVLMSGDDETVEVIWKNRLSYGIYNMSVKVTGEDGYVIDRKDTIIEAKKGKDQGIVNTSVPAQAPGFTLFPATTQFILFYLFSRWKYNRIR